MVKGIVLCLPREQHGVWGSIWYSEFAKERFLYYRKKNKWKYVAIIKTQSNKIKLNKSLNSPTSHKDQVALYFLMFSTPQTLWSPCPHYLWLSEDIYNLLMLENAVLYHPDHSCLILSSTSPTTLIYCYDKLLRLFLRSCQQKKKSNIKCSKLELLSACYQNTPSAFVT